MNKCLDSLSRRGEGKGAPGPGPGPGEPLGRGGSLQETPRRREGSEVQRAKVVRRLPEGKLRERDLIIVMAFAYTCIVRVSTCWPKILRNCPKLYLHVQSQTTFVESNAGSNDAGGCKKVGSRGEAALLLGDVEDAAERKGYPYEEEAWTDQRSRIAYRSRLSKCT